MNSLGSRLISTSCCLFLLVDLFFITVSKVEAFVIIDE